MSHNQVGRIVFAMLLNTVLLGCNLTSSAQPGLPTWVSQPPVNDSSFTVTGAGVSLYEATQNARHNMGALILAEVDSKVSIRATQDGNYAREIMTLTSSVEVSDIPLKHAKVIRQEQDNNTFYVLMSMPKRLFISQLVSQNEAIERRVSPIITTPPALNFEGWWTLHQLNSDMGEMERNLSLLYSLGNDDLSHQRELVTNYFQLLDSSRDNRRLAIRNRTRDKSFGNIVQDQLSRHNIAVNPSSRNQSSIELSLQFQRQSMGREVHIKGQLNVFLLAPNGQVRSQTALNAQTVSITGVADGQNKIKRILAEQLAQTDIITELFEV